MKRILRPLALASATAIASTGLVMAAAAPASAAVLGTPTISPSSGTDATIFGGSVTAACPSGTTDSYWTIDGPDLPTDQAVLAPGSNPTGTGPQSFSGASVANLKSANAGAFSASGTYKIKFNCFGDTSVTDTYEASFLYTAGGAGSWTVPTPPRATGTTLAAAPASPQEAGTAVTFTADVTPTSGSDNPTGSVSFYDGATLLGAGSALTATGVSTFSTSSLGIGSHSITAQYTPSGNFTSSTSPALSYTVNPVAARPTTSVLSVTPTTGNAYQTVTYTCDVTPSTGTAVGSVEFRDGSTSIGSTSAGTASGAATRYTITSGSQGAGAHSYTCVFTGTAPYSNSTSAPVTADYVAAGATPDPQTVTVTIPQGALSITTPYHQSNPLSLGTALLDPATSKYSASAPFGTSTAGWITITDTRAGELGWTASVVSGNFTNGSSSFGGQYAGLNGLSVVDNAGSALNTAQVSLTNTNPNAPGLGSSRAFASYPAAQPLGSVNLKGTFGIAGVPTSVTPGLYTATVTFTAI